MHDEHGHLNRAKIVGEVGFGEGFDAVVVSFDPTHHALAPPVANHAFGNLRTGTIESVEGARGNIEEELSAVARGRRAELVEHL